jgi:hypothetical protein
MEAAVSSNTLVLIAQITLRQISEHTLLKTEVPEKHFNGDVS